MSEDGKFHSSKVHFSEEGDNRNHAKQVPDAIAAAADPLKTSSMIKVAEQVPQQQGSRSTDEPAKPSAAVPTSNGQPPAPHRPEGKRVTIVEDGKQFKFESGDGGKKEIVVASDRKPSVALPRTPRENGDAGSYSF
jgi:hypothetical protein